MGREGLKAKPALGPSEMLGGGWPAAREQDGAGKAAPRITVCIWNWKQAQIRSPGSMWNRIPK